MDILNCRLRKRELKNGVIPLVLEIQSGSSSPFQQDAGSDKPSNWTAVMTKIATDMLRDGEDVVMGRRVYQGVVR